MLHELKECNISPRFISIINHYLQNRFQVVRLSNTLSSPIQVMSGVPQGSVLGSFLFNIFARTLKPKDPKTMLIKFADDATIIIPHRNGTNKNCLEDETINIFEWCNNHNLRLNLKKLKLLMICKKSRPFKDLWMGSDFSSFLPSPMEKNVFCK
jgi:Reverse transcriptase (RNA-dependent DNA polymerase)